MDWEDSQEVFVVEEEEVEVEEPCGGDDDVHETLEYGDNPYQSQDCDDTLNLVHGQIQNQEDAGGETQCQNGGCNNLRSLVEEENLNHEGTVESLS